MLITAMIRIDCAAIYVVFKKFLALISDRLLREIRDGQTSYCRVTAIRLTLLSTFSALP